MTRDQEHETLKYSTWKDPRLEGPLMVLRQSEGASSASASSWQRVENAPDPSLKLVLHQTKRGCSVSGCGVQSRREKKKKKRKHFLAAAYRNQKVVMSSEQAAEVGPRVK